MTRTGFESPEANEVDAFAYRLLASDNALDLAILDRLLAEPLRFRELSVLVSGKSETPLTRALNRLVDAGLVRHGMTLKDSSDPRYYAATKLGVEVMKSVTEHRLIARLRQSEASPVTA